MALYITDKKIIEAASSNEGLNLIAMWLQDKNDQFPIIRFHGGKYVGQGKLILFQSRPWQSPRSLTNNIGITKDSIYINPTSDKNHKNIIQELNEFIISIPAIVRDIKLKAVETTNKGDVFLWRSNSDGHVEIHTFHSDAGYGSKTYTIFNESDGSSILVNYSGICGVLIPKNII